jgi:hypothetical protein
VRAALSSSIPITAKLYSRDQPLEPIKFVQIEAIHPSGMLVNVRSDLIAKVYARDVIKLAFDPIK